MDLFLKIYVFSYCTDPYFELKDFLNTCLSRDKTSEATRKFILHNIWNIFCEEKKYSGQSTSSLDNFRFLILHTSSKLPHFISSLATKAIFVINFQSDTLKLQSLILSNVA